MYVLIAEEYMLTKKKIEMCSTSDVNEQGHCKPSLKRVTSESADLFPTVRHCILCGFQLEDGERLYVWK